MCVDDEALDLAEHRAVGRVVVAAVHHARRDDPDRRRVRLHRPDLHRARCACAARSRRRRRRCPACRARGDPSGSPAPRRCASRSRSAGRRRRRSRARRRCRSRSSRTWVSRCRWPVADRAGGQRDVDLAREIGLRRALARASSRAATARLDRVLDPVGGLADPRPIGRRQLAELLHDLRHLALLAEELGLGGADRLLVDERGDRGERTRRRGDRVWRSASVGVAFPGQHPPNRVSRAKRRGRCGAASLQWPRSPGAEATRQRRWP
jgi:hypothetical protein